jgi:predicted Zn-ribbon and HTH transcriptional regulator
MKNTIEVPLPKKEDIAAANKRRENYAYSRDLLAKEYNESITKRLLANARNQAKCEKCGKEFSAETSYEVSSICPDCK